MGTTSGFNKRLTPETIAFAEQKQLPREFLLEEALGTPWMTSQKNWAMAIENGVTASDPCFAIPAGLFLSPSCISRRNTRQASTANTVRASGWLILRRCGGRSANVDVNVTRSARDHGALRACGCDGSLPARRRRRLSTLLDGLELLLRGQPRVAKHKGTEHI